MNNRNKSMNNRNKSMDNRNISMIKNQKKIFFWLSLVIFLLCYMLSSRLYFRLDMTQNKAFTLSESSRNAAAQISDILRITYFVSDRLLAVHPLPEEITGLLNEYASLSRSRIQFSRVDPAKANLLREMNNLGIYPQSIRFIENNEIITLDVYTGIVIEYLDRIEVIPFAFSYESLEYDLTTRILALVQARHRELGVIVGESSSQWNNDYIFLDSELRRHGFRIRLLIPGEDIPDHLPGLFIFGGADVFDEWTLYTIDRYIQGGGNVLFAQNSLFVDMFNEMQVWPVRDMGLFAMLASYGAVILPALVMDLSCINLSFQANENTQEIITIPYPLWIHVKDENINKNNFLTRNLFGINLYWASPLELHPPYGIDAEVLFTTTDDAWLQNYNYQVDPFRQELLPQDGRRMVLGAAFTGIFPSFFNNMPKPVREGSLQTLPDMPQNPQESRIIVIGDSNFAGSLIQIEGGEITNLAFLLRAADWLINNEETTGLHRTGPGRLDRITDIFTRNAVMLFSNILNIFIIPFIIFIFGLVITIKRKKNTVENNTSIQSKG